MIMQDSMHRSSMHKSVYDDMHSNMHSMHNMHHYSSQVLSVFADELNVGELDVVGGYTPPPPTG